jgi:hypothetical protein
VRQRWQRRYVAYESGLCLIATALTIAWSEACGGAPELTSYLIDHQDGLFTASAGLYGTLLGFIIAAAAVILDKVEQLRLVRESAHYRDLWDTLLAAMRALGLACMVSVVGLLVTHPGLVQRIVFFGWTLLSLLSVARVARCVWVLGRIVTILSAVRAGSRGPGD